MAVSPEKLPDVPVLEVAETRDVALHPPRLVRETGSPLEKGHDRPLDPERQLHPVMQMLRTPLPAVVSEDGFEGGAFSGWRRHDDILIFVPLPHKTETPVLSGFEPLITRVCCGGPIKKFQRFFGSETLQKCLEITIDLKPKGKRRWPYGFEILRKFRYPRNYPVPEEYRDPPETG